MNIQDNGNYHSLISTTFPLRKNNFLSFSDQELSQYFQFHSFLEEFNLRDLTQSECPIRMTNEHKDILFKLIKLNSKMTMLEIQNTPILRYCVLNEFEAYFKNDNESVFFKALSTVDKLDKIISDENLLRILIFIRENPLLEIAGGVMSRSRPHLRKFHATKYDIPSDLHVNTNTHEIIVKLEFLAKGTFKTVKKILCFSPIGVHMQVIAKQLNSETARQELRMLKLAKDLAHVISLHGYENYKSQLKNKMIQSTIYPMCNMGSLFDHLKSESISYSVKLKIITDFLKGIHGLHERGIIHRDIKPANILLNKVLENKLEVIQVFIADFGLSCQREGVQKDYSRHVIRGTPFYMPPNLLRIGSSSTLPEKVASSDYDMDAWAAGITIYEFLNGPHPLLSVKTVAELIKKYEELSDPFLNPAPENENSIEYVIWGLRQPDTAKRLTVQEAHAKVLKIIEINNYSEFTV